MKAKKRPRGKCEKSEIKGIEATAAEAEDAYPASVFSRRTNLNAEHRVSSPLVRLTSYPSRQVVFFYLRRLCFIVLLFFCSCLFFFLSLPSFEYYQTSSIAHAIRGIIDESCCCCCCSGALSRELSLQGKQFERNGSTWEN